MKRLSAILIIFTAVVSAACERRAMTDSLEETALIPVRIDWSLSGIQVSKMHRASVLLFPEGGGEPLEYFLETNLYYRLIEVPVGVYSVVIFNETRSGSDWVGVAFANTDSYETFAAMSIPDTDTRGFYSYSAALPLIKNPEPLAAWSLDRFEVTLDIVKRTRASHNVEEEVPDLTVAKPLPRTEKMIITANVTNLASSMQATGTLNGMASGVYMVSGEKITVPAAHAFILNGRVYVPNGKDGTTTRTFDIFGKLPASEGQSEMNIDFVLNDGTLHPTETFDVTTMFGSVEDAIPPTNTLSVGYSVTSPDHPIILPSMNVGSGITVDDWEDVIIPL